MIAEILFPVAIDQTFTYIIPDELKDKIKPGIRVYASFSHRDKVLGYVISVSEKANISSEYQLKKIDKIIDEKPVYIFEKLIEISNFISGKWYSPKGLVLASFLRYLPVKFKPFKNSDKINNKNISEKLVKSDRSSDNIEKNSIESFDFIPPSKDILYLNPDNANKIISIILDILNKNLNAVIFFPNIFSLKLFEKILLEYIEPSKFKTYSSSLTTSQKKEVFTLMSKNELKLILTTKAGVFLPFNPDTVFLIIDPVSYMYKQFDQHPYYDSVELMDKVAKVYNNKIIYISHSWKIDLMLKNQNNELDVKGKIKTLENVKILDIKKQNIISTETQELIAQYLSLNKKILIISYSKYMAGTVYCPSCHWIKKCSVCGRIMRLESFEGEKEYICSFCGKKEDYSQFCPQCKTTLIEKGYGSQKLYYHFKELFPSKKILEIDGRVIHSKFLFEEKLEQINTNDMDILIGTEIVLNSALNINFGLIIIVAYESSQSYDYQYFEKFLDKLMIAGNLLDKDGKFIVFTFNPNNYVFNNLNNIEESVKFEFEMRKKFNYPPFCQLYLMEIISRDKDSLKKSVNELINIVDEKFSKEYGIIEFNYKYKIKKIRNEKFYRHKSYIKLNNYENFFNFLKDFSKTHKLQIDIKGI